jgi:hypothetical protein
MTLVQLTDVKTFLGIDDSDLDTELTSLIPQAEAFFYSLLKVDTLEAKTNQDEIAIFNNKSIWVKNFPVKAINSIGGVNYTGESFEDYIATKNKVLFHDPSFLDKVKANRIKINYNYGYDPEEIPDDLKLGILILISGLYNVKENYGTIECKVGQETFKFRDSTEGEDFNRILNNYKKKFILVM